MAWGVSRGICWVLRMKSMRHAVSLGVDSMDSCYPTKLGGCGTLMTRKEGLIRIKRGKQKRCFGVKVDDECGCSTCRNYDRAYLCHLFKANEPLGIFMATLHNIHYMNDLMKTLRQNIMEDRI
mmetsp:Transcript_56930/g.68152  ORF Transcript_56930/g.68152 Transcript_56930/m.68152 type:complete len:123 (+) Transcript_56930:55-423(+)